MRQERVWGVGKVIDRNGTRGERAERAERAEWGGWMGTGRRLRWVRGSELGAFVVGGVR